LERCRSHWLILPQVVPKPEPVKQPKPKKQKAKNDPAMVAKVRELNARWMEQVNANPSLLLPAGKYEVCKALAGPAGPEPVALIEAA
jgi:hypothetical protein